MPKRIQEVEQQYREKNKQLEDLELALSVISKAQEQYNGQLQDLRDRRAALEKEIRRLQQQQERMEEKVRRIEEKVAACEKALEALQKELEAKEVLRFF